MKLFFIESPGRKVINVISNFLPTVIIPTVILLEGFCATIVHALLNIIDFFSVPSCVCPSPDQIKSIQQKIKMGHCQ